MSNKMLDKITEMAALRERERIANLRAVENAKNQERSRIIKLLEEHQPSELGQEFGIYPCTCGYDSPDIDLSQHHIALIKGEK